MTTKLSKLSIFSTLRGPSVHRKDWQALTLLEPTHNKPGLDPLAVLHLDNQLFYFIYFYFIPLPSSRDCSPVSGPTTWLMFATTVRGLELSEILGLLIQICEILSQQWNWVFSPLDVAAIFLFPSFFEHEHLFYMSEFFVFISHSKIPILHQE